MLDPEGKIWCLMIRLQLVCRLKGAHVAILLLVNLWSMLFAVCLKFKDV